MARAMRVCPTSGCPELTTGGRCDDCRAKAEQRRGSAAKRGYGHKHSTRFRPGVLRKHPLCVCTDRQHGHGPQCLAPSAHADHWPRDRTELVRLGLDPDDPQYGRGLCQPCHSSETAAHQPGGWHAR